MTKMTYDEENEEWNDILEEAFMRWKLAHSGARGQTVTMYDDTDYWVYKVTKERYEGGS